MDGHSGGESEAILGKWFQRGGARDKIVIATKVGMDMKTFGKGLSKTHILRSADASLKRLGVEQIDLYQAHIDDAAVPLRTLCLDQGLAVLPYYALAGGFLTGKYRKESDLAGQARAQTVAHYLDPRGLDILVELDKIGARLGATPAQVAIAWGSWRNRASPHPS